VLEFAKTESISRQTSAIPLEPAVRANSLPRRREKRTMREPEFQKRRGLAASIDTKNAYESVARKISGCGLYAPSPKRFGASAWSPRESRRKR